MLFHVFLSRSGIVTPFVRGCVGGLLTRLMSSGISLSARRELMAGRSMAFSSPLQRHAPDLATGRAMTAAAWRRQALWISSGLALFFVAVILGVIFRRYASCIILRRILDVVWEKSGKP